jgi:hypothetical protein
MMQRPHRQSGLGRELTDLPYTLGSGLVHPFHPTSTDAPCAGIADVRT